MIKIPESRSVRNKCNVYFNFKQFFHYNGYESLRPMHNIRYPLYQYCREETIDKILLCIAASHWDNVQFLKIIKWFIDTLSNSKQKKIENWQLSDTMLLVDTVIQFALFAEKFDRDSNLNDDTYSIHIGGINSSDKRRQYNYNDYFKDLSKVNYILKYIIDINDNIENIRNGSKKINYLNHNGYDHNKKIVVSVLASNDITAFWQKYKEFVLYLLFGNYKPIPRTDDIMQERCDIVYLFHEILSTNDDSCLNDKCKKYNSTYVEQFKKCLNYLQRLFIQSIKIGSSSYNAYCTYMNREFVTLSQKQGFVIYYPFGKELIDIIILALDLPQNEHECKLMFK